MSLREALTKPLVLAPLARGDHTHTVIFLHRYPQDTTEKALLVKVLSARHTKSTQSLRLEFPTVRWVYPHPKLAGTDGTHWTGLDDRDIGILDLESGRDLPYITQIILQEAKRVGGLERIIIGGQGDTAVAAHDAMCRLPELPRELYNDSGEVKRFLHDHLGSSGDAIGDLRLGGYVGMHPDNGQLTRDERSYSLMSRLGGGNGSTSGVAVANTPHLFIRGGYGNTTAVWGGQRIDDFADFLASTVGVFRNSGGASGTSPTPSPAAPGSINSEAQQRPQGPRLEADFVADPAQRRAAALASQRDLEAQRKHAETVARAKRAEENYRKLLRERIETDKRDRAAVQAQRRQNRLEAERAAAAAASSSQQRNLGIAVGSQANGRPPYSQEEDGEKDGGEGDVEEYGEEYGMIEEYGKERGGQDNLEEYYGPGRSDFQRWLPPPPRRTMAAQRLMALGVYQAETENKTEDRPVKGENGH